MRRIASLRIGLVAAIVMLLPACAAGGSPPQIPGPPSPLPTATETPEATAPPTVDATQAKIDTGNGWLIGIAWADDAAWIASYTTGELLRIDPIRNRVAARIKVGKGALVVAAGAGSVWVTNHEGGTISRIDPRTNAVTATFTAGDHVEGIAIGFGSVWATLEPTAELLRLDPATGAIQARLKVGAGPRHVEVGTGAVWVTGAFSNDLRRVNPATNTVGPRIRSGAGSEGIAPTTDGRVWVAALRDGSVSEVDTRSGQMRQQIRVGDGVEGLLLMGDSLWAVCQTNQTIWRLDAATGRPMGAARIGREGRRVVFGAGSLWVPARDGTVWRLDPAKIHA